MSERFSKITPRGEWTPTVPREPAESPCKASCCKSPYGHSTVKDHLPPWHRDACHCHDNPKEN